MPGRGASSPNFGTSVLRPPPLHLPAVSDTALSCADRAVDGAPQFPPSPSLKQFRTTTAPTHRHRCCRRCSQSHVENTPQRLRVFCCCGQKTQIKPISRDCQPPKTTDLRAGGTTPASIGSRSHLTGHRSYCLRILITSPCHHQTPQWQTRDAAAFETVDTAAAKAPSLTGIATHARPPGTSLLPLPAQSHLSYINKFVQQPRPQEIDVALPAWNYYATFFFGALQMKE